jgi:hypothetical protein
MNLGHLPLGLPTDSSSYRTRAAPHRTQARCASKATALAWLALEAFHECISLRLDQPSNTPLLGPTPLEPIIKPYRKEVCSLIESNLVTARGRYLPNLVQVSQKRLFINFLRFVYTSCYDSAKGNALPKWRSRETKRCDLPRIRIGDQKITVQFALTALRAFI